MAVNNGNNDKEPILKPSPETEGENEDEKEEEEVSFLCWRVTKQKRRKIILTLTLYLGVFAVVRLVSIHFFFGGHMSFFGATGTPVLDFW